MKWIKKIKYVPILDELCFFIMNRAFSYQKRKFYKTGNIHSSVRIGKNCKIDQNVFIDKHTYFGDNCHFYAGKNSSVHIGSYCAIGHNVHIKARTHDLSQPFPTDDGGNKRIEKNIWIGDKVWIGDNVFIREGVSVGNNSVIGANSVVTKDIEAYSVYAGVPARKIKSIELNSQNAQG